MDLFFRFVDTSHFFSFWPTVRVKTFHMTVVLCGRTLAWDVNGIFSDVCCSVIPIGLTYMLTHNTDIWEGNELRSTAELRHGGTRPLQLPRISCAMKAPTAGLLKPSVHHPWGFRASESSVISGFHARLGGDPRAAEQRQV